MKNHLLFLIILLTSCAFRPTPIPTPTSIPNLLSGTEWKLDQIRGQPVLQDYPVFLYLREEQITGEMGCNSYQAQYQENHGTIQIDQLAVTVELCLDKDLMNQEERYLKAWNDVALGRQASYRLGSNILEIQDASGSIILSFKTALMEPK